MKSLSIYGKEDMKLVDVPTPEPKEGQVRVAIKYVGICGSDIHYYFNGANGEYVVREPLSPGHELSGVVDLDPSGQYAAGTPVTIHPAHFGHSLPGIEDRPHLWPGGDYLGSASTWPHTQGGAKEFIIVDKDMIRVLPEGLPVRRAALSEPLSVALHALNRAHGVKGQRILVSGAGPIGLLVLAAAKSAGAASVAASDVLPGPLSRAKALGTDAVFQVSEEKLPDEAFDIVFECSGVPAAISPLFKAVRKAGTIVQVGMLPDEARPVNLAAMVSKEIDVRGSFRFYNEIDDAVVMLAEHPEIEKVITHEVPVNEAVKAFEIARNSEESGKVLIAF